MDDRAAGAEPGGGTTGDEASPAEQTRTAVQRQRSVWRRAKAPNEPAPEQRVLQGSKKDEDIMLDALEPEQFSFVRHQPLPRRNLRPWELTTLWILRVYVFVVLLLAAVQFVRTIHPG